MIPRIPLLPDGGDDVAFGRVVDGLEPLAGRGFAAPAAVLRVGIIGLDTSHAVEFTKI